MSKHTPGPWAVINGPGKDCVSVVGSGFVSWEVGSWTQDFWVHGGQYDDRGKATAMANARLIAAAPEMLEALKKIIRENPAGRGFPGFAEAVVAINKAEGRL